MKDNEKCLLLDEARKLAGKKWPRKGIYQECLFCSKEYYLRQSYVKRKNSKYCSNRCRVSYIKEHGSFSKGKHLLALTGKKCHLWKGGITPINRKIKTSLEYYLWRTAVYERDSYSCQECGLKRGWNKKLKKTIILDAHHIKPFAYYPELRFAIDNGKALCRDCHRITDSYAGKIRWPKSVSNYYERMSIVE